MAESKGFEPLWRCRLTVFKTYLRKISPLSLRAVKDFQSLKKPDSMGIKAYQTACPRQFSNPFPKSFFCTVRVPTVKEVLLG